MATLWFVVTVPDRLLDLPAVDVAYASPGLTVLRKVAAAPLYERPTYLATHALTLVRAGEHVLYDEGGGGPAQRLRVGAGQVGLLPRGLYAVTDLLGDAGAFAATVIFFDDATLRAAAGGLLAGGAVGEWGDAPRLTRLPASAAVRAWATVGPPSVASLTGPAADAYHAHRFAELLALLVAAGGDGTAEALARLLRARRRPLRDFMLAHADKPLAVADYARLTGQSERAFRRNFRARFGESPKRWLVRRRLERARELLEAEGATVRGVAAEVGYRSTSQFIERYQGAFGVTPGVLLREGGGGDPHE